MVVAGRGGDDSPATAVFAFPAPAMRARALAVEPFRFVHAGIRIRVAVVFIRCALVDFVRARGVRPRVHSGIARGVDRRGVRSRIELRRERSGRTRLRDRDPAPVARIVGQRLGIDARVFAAARDATPFGTAIRRRSAMQAASNTSTRLKVRPRTKPLRARKVTSGWPAVSSAVAVTRYSRVTSPPRGRIGELERPFDPGSGRQAAAVLLVERFGAACAARDRDLDVVDARAQARRRVDQHHHLRARDGLAAAAGQRKQCEQRETHASRRELQSVHGDSAARRQRRFHLVAAVREQDAGRDAAADDEHHGCPEPRARQHARVAVAVVRRRNVARGQRICAPSEAGARGLRGARRVRATARSPRLRSCTRSVCSSPPTTVTVRRSGAKPGAAISTV